MIGLSRCPHGPLRKEMLQPFGKVIQPPRPQLALNFVRVAYHHPLGQKPCAKIRLDNLQPEDRESTDAKSLG